LIFLAFDNTLSQFFSEHKQKIKRSTTTAQTLSSSAFSTTHVLVQKQSVKKPFFFAQILNFFKKKLQYFSWFSLSRKCEVEQPQ